MKPFFKFIVIVSIIPLLIGLYFFGNIKGYYRFKHYCAKDGGLQVYESLEKGEGWWAKDEYEARVAAVLEHVGFVRYFDKKQSKIYDLRYLGGDPQLDSSFVTDLSDESKNILYKLNYINEAVKNELRLRKYGYEISDFSTGRLLARFYMYSYSKFDRDKTVLDMPSGVTCFNDVVGVDALIHSMQFSGVVLNYSIEQPSQWRQELNTAFKK